jgi:ketosteroid isomerase-like protein
MENQPVSELVRRCFAAYQAQDRAAMEALLAEDFTFTSPYDDHIDRACYFERCWSSSVTMRSFRAVRIVEQGDEAFILYEAVFAAGPPVRNVEYFRTKDGKIKSVEVFFGSPARRVNA